MRRRAFLQVLAASPALLGADEELRVAVNQTTIESAPLFVQPIPGVRVVPVANGRAASAQLVSGMVDAATGSETQALVNSVAQPDLRIVLTLAECRYRMVARRSAGVQRVADLRGKRVAITANTSSEYFLVEMLGTARLTKRDVQVTSMEGPDMPAALSKREIDAVAMWEPHAQNAIAVLGDDAVVLEDPKVYFERFNLNTNLRVLSDPGKRRVLVNLIRAVRQVSRQLERSPRNFMPVLAKAIATPEPVIAKVWGQFRFPAGLDERELRAMLVKMEPWATTIGHRQPRSAATLAALVDGSVVAEAGK